MMYYTFVLVIFFNWLKVKGVLFPELSHIILLLTGRLWGKKPSAVKLNIPCLKMQPRFKEKTDVYVLITKALESLCGLQR